MREKGLVVNGFLFSINSDYNDAKQEQEAIDHFRSKLNLSNPQEAQKLYSKILDKQSFHTPVGYCFLKELQDIIINSGIANIEDLDGIYVPANDQTIGRAGDDMDTISVSHYKELAATEKIRHRNSRIINIFLAFIIIAMMAIALYADKTVYSNFENEVIDRYETWEEKLNAREQKLDEREAYLDSIDKNNGQ